MSRPTLDVALVSCRRLPEPDPDAAPLAAALDAAGLSYAVLAWDDPASDFSRARLTVLRSCWNYPRHHREFLAWAEATAAVSELWNPLPAVRFNLHKSYLLRLAESGLPTAPTRLVAAGAAVELAALLAETGWREVVIKPAISAASLGTRRFAPGEAEAAQRHLDALAAEGDVLVQRYLPSVEGYGERAVVWVDGALTHAVRKSPRFEGQDEEVSAAADIDPAERRLGEEAMAVARRLVGAPLFYARIDMAPGPDGAPMLMELELLEPSLFFEQGSAADPNAVPGTSAFEMGALGRFVAGLQRRLALTLLCLLLAWPVAAGAATAAQWPSAGAEASTAPPSILLITVDTLRPDALGWVAGTPPEQSRTPVIDRLAREGVRFPAALTPVPLTLPAHASILSGLLPRRHGVRDNGQLFAAGLPTLTERLAAAGYATAAFVSGFPLQATFGLDRGFDRYDDRLPEGREGWVERSAEGTTRAAIEWLGELGTDGGRPWFVWIHYYDPHDPYEPPRQFWEPGERGAYDGEVAYVDAWLGELLPAARRAAGGELLTVFTADHGEALGAHQESTHGYFLYDTTMRVPLIFHRPGRLAPRHSDRPARLIDLAPTLLELAGQPPLPAVDGVSLLPTLTGREQELPPAYLETQLPWRFFGWAPLAALVAGRNKLVVAPRPELYDLAADPVESENLYDRQRRLAAELLAELRAIEELPPATALGGTGAAVADPETLARLRALGYVGAGGGGEAPGPGGGRRGLADPKDRIEERRRLLAGEELLRAGRLAEAVALFDQVLAAEPDNRYANLRSGIALLKAGRPAAAVARLERAVAADPERAEARYALADALTRGGDPAAAVEHWMELVRLQPRRVEGWANLAAALAATGERAKAVDALREALAIEPDNRALAERLAELEAAPAGDP